MMRFARAAGAAAAATLLVLSAAATAAATGTEGEGGGGGTSGVRVTDVPPTSAPGSSFEADFVLDVDEVSNPGDPPRDVALRFVVTLVGAGTNGSLGLPTDATPNITDCVVVAPAPDPQLRCTFTVDNFVGDTGRITVPVSIGSSAVAGATFTVRGEILDNDEEAKDEATTTITGSNTATPPATPSATPAATPPATPPTANPTKTPSAVPVPTAVPAGEGTSAGASPVGAATAVGVVALLAAVGALAARRTRSQSG